MEFGCGLRYVFGLAVGRHSRPWGRGMTEPDEPRYRAFISYSHADEACAGWLHRELESYRIPAKLVGRETPAGVVPTRLTPIFKDREELPASGDLTNELRTALGSSQFLIVIASPAAAGSRWVNEEIRTFKRSRGEAGVLVLIAAGEPGMSAIRGREAEECFPETLRRRVDTDGNITDVPAEPIAADLRPQGDGKRLAKLKLVAGLTGLELDALVQREAQRRARRMTALAVFAMLVAVIMTTLSVLALRARNEAEHQRAEADGLVEYMLTDLRAKLEPVGRLDVLDSVGERALKYYAGQSLGALDADALGRRSRALHLVGEVRHMRGDSAGALAAFREAAATTQELLARAPNDGQRIFDHAQSVFWIGYVAWQRGDIKTGRNYFTQYLNNAQRLAKIAPTNVAWNGEVGYANSSLGVLELEDDRPDDAYRYFENARRVWATLSARAPGEHDPKYNLAQTLAWKADTRRKMFDPQGALADRRQEIGIYQDLLTADPNDNKAKEGLSVAWLRMAQLQLEAGLTDEAMRLADRSLQSIQALHRQDPSNRLWQEIAVKSANVRAESLMMAGQWRTAGDVNRWALDRAKGLVALDKTFAEWRSDCLMPARWMDIAITQALGDSATARRKIEDFEGEFPSVAQPKSDDERFARIMVYMLSGINWRSLNDDAKSAASFAQALDLLPQDARHTDTRLVAAASFLRKASGHRGNLAVLTQPQFASHYNLRALLFQTAGR